jgi:hypothetical protein
MSLASYKAKRIPEIKISHPHLISHRQRMDIIMHEWQTKIKSKLSISKLDKPTHHNERWTKMEEDQLIDEIIMGKSHNEIANIHRRTLASIIGRLYAIAINLIKQNKTTISDIVTIFDINRDFLCQIINKSLMKHNK